MSPLARFNADRKRAFGADDPMAAVCVLATVDADDVPQARTLVLREVGERLALFVNATSPKWHELASRPRAAVLTWWPSVQIQYRLTCRLEPLDQAVVAESWQLRPDVPKRMDWLYSSVQAQSTPVVDRDALLDTLTRVALPEPLIAPETARGVLLDPLTVERLHLGQSDGVHDRVRYTRDSGEWRAQTLVP